MERTSREWADLAEALAFCGNSLLAPMSQTGDVALDPAFWGEFPSFGDDDIADAIASCRSYAEGAWVSTAEGVDAVQRTSVEYTRLFVGPPRPAAAPWETMHRGSGAAVGFGEATFEMRRLLREAGLEVSNENNQYADHIGIELLYASVLCGRLAGCEGGREAQTLQAQLATFAAAHPLAWMGDLAATCEDAAPGGFIARILRLAEALLRAA